MKPKVGDQVRVMDVWQVEHICTVRDLCDTQFSAVYEFKLPNDAGWRERILWAFYKDHRGTWEIQK